MIKTMILGGLLTTLLLGSGCSMNKAKTPLQEASMACLNDVLVEFESRTVDGYIKVVCK